MSDQLLHKIEQTAERLQRSPRKIFYLIAAGELEVVHDGRSVRVVVASEDAYVERLRQREKGRRAAKTEAGGSPIEPNQLNRKAEAAPRR